MFKCVQTRPEGEGGRPDPEGWALLHDTCDAIQQVAADTYLDGDLEGSERLYTKLAMFQQQTLGEQNPSTLLTFAGMAGVHEGKGDLPKARKLYFAVFQQQSQTLGPQDPLTQMTAVGLAQVLRDTDEFGSADKLLRGAAAFCAEAYGEEPNFLTVMVKGRSFHFLAVMVAVLCRLP